MNKFAKKINSNLKHLKVEPDTAWLAQTRSELVGHIASVKIKPKRRRIFHDYSEAFKMLLQPMPVAMASFGLTLLIGSAAISHSQTALPGDALYPVKLASEQVVLSLTGDSQSQSELKAAFKNRRLAELSEIARKSEPVSTGNYKTNSIFAVTHVNNDIKDTEQEVTQPKSVPVVKLSQATTNPALDKAENQLKTSNDSFPPTKAPGALTAPTSADTELPTDDMDSRLAAKAESLDTENNFADINTPAQEQTKIADAPDIEELVNEQPLYAYLSGGSSAAVTAPVNRPVNNKVDNNEAAETINPAETLSDNAEIQPAEQDSKTNSLISVPLSEIPIISETATQPSSESAAPTPTSTKEAVTEDEVGSTPAEEQTDKGDENIDPAQDQPTETSEPDEPAEELTGESGTDGVADNEAKDTDDSEVSESEGEIIKIESNFPREDVNQ